MDWKAIPLRPNILILALIAAGSLIVLDIAGDPLPTEVVSMILGNITGAIATMLSLEKEKGDPGK